jgi:hypothetical protein
MFTIFLKKIIANYFQKNIGIIVFICNTFVNVEIKVVFVFMILTEDIVVWDVKINTKHEKT